MIKPTNSLLLSPEQQAAAKRDQEEKRRRLAVEFEEAKEQLMRGMGVIEIAILKIDPITGIVASSVILPHQWSDGETYLAKATPNTTKPEVEEDLKKKKDGKKNKKTK